MKNLFLVFLFAAFLTSCHQPRQHFQIARDKQYFIIDGVEKSAYKEFGKYVYSVQDQNGEVLIYLNEKYTIGDTLVIKKK